MHTTLFFHQRTHTHTHLHLHICVHIRLNIQPFYVSFARTLFPHTQLYSHALFSPSPIHPLTLFNFNSLHFPSLFPQQTRTHIHTHPHSHVFISSRSGGTADQAATIITGGLLPLVVASLGGMQDLRKEVCETEYFYLCVSVSVCPSVFAWPAWRACRT